MHIREVAMPLYIRDDEVGAMAQRLAADQKTTVTEAVRRALIRELAELAREKAAREQALRDLFARFDHQPAAAEFGDRDLYDDDGLPR